MLNTVTVGQNVVDSTYKNVQNQFSEMVQHVLYQTARFFWGTYFTDYYEKASIDMVSKSSVFIFQILIILQCLSRYSAHFLNCVLWTFKQQESIPVGCLPPALVATTRCQHCWGVPFRRGCTFQFTFKGGVPSRVYLLGGVPSLDVTSSWCT